MLRRGIYIKQQVAYKDQGASGKELTWDFEHIYQEGELLEISTCRKFRQVQQEGNRMVNREIPFYNLHNQSNSSRHQDRTLILSSTHFFMQ